MKPGAVPARDLWGPAFAHEFNVQPWEMDRYTVTELLAMGDWIKQASEA